MCSLVEIHAHQRLLLLLASVAHLHILVAAATVNTQNTNKNTFIIYLLTKYRWHTTLKSRECVIS